MAILLMFTISIVGPMIGIHLAVDDPEPSDKSEAPTADEQRDELAGAVVPDRTPDGEGR